MKLARITAVVALATLAAPLAVSASEEQSLTQIESIRHGRSERSASEAPSAAAGATVRAEPSNGRTLTQIEGIRHNRSERSDPN